MSLVGRWTFAGMGGLWDETEQWQKLEMFGDTRLTHRGLELKKGGWARAQAAPNTNLTFSQKTLISWLILDDLADKRPQGSALTLRATAGGITLTELYLERYKMPHGLRAAILGFAQTRARKSQLRKR